MEKTTAKAPAGSAGIGSVGPIVNERLKKKRLILTAILLFVFIAGGWLAYSSHQNNRRAEAAYQADKVRFAKVEADMEKAYAAMVGAVGMPVKEESNKGCSRVSLKFEEGQLGCSLGRSFFYGMSSYQEALGYFLSAQDKIEETGLFRTSHGPLNEELKRRISDKSSSLYEQEGDVEIRFVRPDLVSCKLRMSSYNPKTESSYSDVVANRAIEYHLGCYQDMERPIYPVTH